MTTRGNEKVTFAVESEYAPAVRALLALLRQATAQLTSKHRKNTFRRTSGRWHIVYSGHEFSIKDRVGLAYVAVLLAKPGVAVRALDLADRSGASVDWSGAHLFDPVLDEKAREEYRSRLGEINNELARTLDAGDTEHRASLRAEKDVIEDQLRVSTGLGGRRRAFVNDQERARLQVTRAISRAISEIGKLSPELANHLRLSIAKGADSMYDPAEKISWKL